MLETGSFGKSRRRSRSKSSGIPTKREAPSQQAADEVFSNFLSSQAKPQTQSSTRKQSIPSSSSQAQASGISTNKDGKLGEVTRYVHKEPTEIVLRGFGFNQTYAAIKHYETLAGRICEDYPRDPPLEQRRYKAEIRDQAALRTIPLTAEEKEKARRYAGGDHWIKVTFESAEAADSALYTSPQAILGHLVYAEAYNGTPPSNTEAIPAPRQRLALDDNNVPPASLFTARKDRSNKSATTSGEASSDRHKQEKQPSDEQTDVSSSTSQTSSSSATIGASMSSSSSTTVVADTQTSTSVEPESTRSEYCRRIPTARRATLLPASEALLPQKTLTQRISSHIPLLSWLGRDVIGSQVPRTEDGDFDWAVASFYWRLCWLLDFYFRLMNGDLVGKVD